jgi:RNA polymerase sigma-70 factor (ECF subfamily)
VPAQVAAPIFFQRARRGDFEALISLLDPDVVLRSDGGVEYALTVRIEGAAAVTGRATMFANLAARLYPVVVNGGAGVVATVEGRPFSLMAFTVVGGYIVEIDAIADPNVSANSSARCLPRSEVGEKGCVRGRPHCVRPLTSNKRAL